MIPPIGKYKLELVSSTESDVKNPFIIWFTGLSGSGKTTMAHALSEHFRTLKARNFILDGDLLRAGINADLGFTDEDRTENIRRASELAKIIAELHTIVICCFISPLKKQRDLAKKIIGPERFVEVYLDCPLDVCIARDTKGLYKKALQSEIAHFTGINMDYEIPDSQNVTLYTSAKSVAECLKELTAFLEA
jgi:adenylyl-sulfate kinase